MDRYLIPPELPGLRRVVLPVFIPFAGCPGRCVYCAQHLQTGMARAAGLAEIRHNLQTVLAGAEAAGHRQAELAFYGGTFTLLPFAWQKELLAALFPWREKGVIAAARCSTRPDAVPDETLRRLKPLGLTGIELGVQTFADESLTLSGRGYTGADARDACRRVRAHGFSLGVQLLPGLPGMDQDMFRNDVAVCLDLAPDLMRLYPCLVIKDTRLAGLWAAGEYQPWDLKPTVRLLAEALLELQRARIRTARLGLHLGGGFAQNILAGPVHPGLGGMVRGLALYLWIKEHLESSPQPVAELCAPRAWQGAFWGHRGGLKSAYAALGLTPGKVIFWDWPLFRLKAFQS